MDRTIKKNIYYNNTQVLTYTIHYPQLFFHNYQEFLNQLNSYYESKAREYEHTLTTRLLRMALEEYDNSIANNYPVRSFEAFVDYTITLNQNCLFSLYFDQYEYTGGAHGITLRYSDSWNLQKEKRIMLGDLFPNHDNYKHDSITMIQEQIAKQIKQGTFYFDHYHELVTQNFNENSFYLTPEGIVIYFQQYDIAPYSSGIMTFTIPYHNNIVLLPPC